MGNIFKRSALTRRTGFTLVETGRQRRPSGVFGALSLTGFTPPLEKTTDLKSDSFPLKTEGGIKPLSGQTFRKRSSLTGFTLVELMLAAAILAFALVGLLVVFINCIILNESNRNFILAYSASQARMEEIKSINFTNLSGLSGTPFSLSGFSTGTSQGRIVVSGTGRLRNVTIFACFMSRNRLIGDNITNCQFSPARLITQIAEP